VRARNEYWQGEAGHGATRNGVPLIASTAQLAGARVPTLQLPREDADMVAVDQPNSIALRAWPW
jgi:myo-inositol-1(or 4)-monophosphatase